MAKRDFLVSIDLNKNELLNARIQNLASDPSTPVEGQIYWNTTNHTLYGWTGTVWLNLGSQGSGSTDLGYTASATNGTVTSSTGTSATIPLATPSGGTNLAGLLSPGDKTKIDNLPTTSEDASNKATTLETMNDTLYPSVDALFQSREITSADTLVQSDNGGIVYLNSATPFNLTIPQLTAKTQITFVNIGTATVTFVNGSGVTFIGQSTISGNYNVAGIVYRTATAPLIFTGGQTAAITSLGGLTAATQTFSNDTNVTITSATSTHTLGWSGQLAVSRGGTGTSTGSITGTGALTFTAGGTNTNVNLVPNGSGTVDVASKRITNVATPTSGTDAVNKSYVDALSTGLDAKASVRLASTGNVTVTYAATGGTSTRGQITAAPNTLDSVSLAANDRILLKDQSTGAQNGIWVVTTLGTGANGVWDRATDFDADAEVTSGAYVWVEEGTVNQDSGWILTTNNPITIGGASGTALTWVLFSSASALVAGNGLTKTGNAINVASHAGLAGTIGTINISADAIGVNLGTTSTTAAAGNHNHDGTYPKKYAIGTAASTVTTVTHNLGTRDVITQIYDGTSYAIVEAQIVNTDANTVTVTFNTATTANQYRIVVIG